MTGRHPLRVSEYLEHILEAIDRAMSYVHETPDAQTFERQWREQDAVLRCIIVIGEAATKILKADASFVARHPAIPWNEMSTMRNRVVHDYFEVDTDIVWSTIKNDLPRLRAQIVGLLSAAQASGSQPRED